MTINTDRLGWLAAAALAGAMAMGALSGFQANTAPKFATVDMLKAYNDSTLATTNNDTLDNAKKVRLTALDFINRNPAMESANAKRFAELSTKSAPTAADKTQIDALKAEAEAATLKRNELMTKSAPTDAEKVSIADYATRATANRTLLNSLSQQYDSELQTMAGDLRDKTLTRVREVVRNIAARQGYTIVFDASSAPYAANDLTEEAAKVLKK